ncbi:WD-40 repeat-containing protein [Reticulomyxa filosa]|uniref:WD-40 repeat-containing protein n=1 Tax=Reticulomyxa filosa TaxID=46433 RepID=X6LNU8_RETFI|nr:WD-40 repeat-containing protein [Reticulomyxa filosa]|eukprot:ETO03613.1 WD-40 repeat-containing protein [Reticulomyxa filosa]
MYDGKKKSADEVNLIINNWIRQLPINWRWIPDFSKLVGRYAKSFKLSKFLEGHSHYVNTVKFSPDGTKIVSASCDKTIRIWDIRSGKEIKLLKGHSDIVNEAQFSPDGSTIVSCSKDNTIRLWDIYSGHEIKRIYLNNIASAKFTSNGKSIVFSLCNAIGLWDITTEQNIKILGDLDITCNLQCSPNDQIVVFALNDNTIVIWNVKTNEIIHKLKGHCGTVEKIAFSSNGRFIVSCSKDKTIRLWDITSGKGIKILEGHSGWVTDAQPSLNFQTIVSCSWDAIRLWDVNSGHEIMKFNEYLGAVGIDISPDGNTIVSYSSHTIRLWR